MIGLKNKRCHPDGFAVEYAALGRPFLQNFKTFQREIAKNCEINKMTSSNLAICVAPCLMRTSDFGIPAHKIVRFLIDNYDSVFVDIF